MSDINGNRTRYHQPEPICDPGGSLTRRSLFVGATAILLSGCAATARPTPKPTVVEMTPPLKGTVPPMYDAMPDEQFPIPAVDLSQVDPKFWRQEVDYPTQERPGTIIVDTPAKHLYHVLPGQRARPAAMASVSAARVSPGPAWSLSPTNGNGRAGRRRPTWWRGSRRPSPTASRTAAWGRAEQPVWRARALLPKDGHDTLYRIHGSPTHGDRQGGLVRLHPHAQPGRRLSARLGPRR